MNRKAPTLVVAAMAAAGAITMNADLLLALLYGALAASHFLMLVGVIQH